MKAQVDRRVMWSFGLVILLSLLLLFVAVMELTRYAQRTVFRGPAAWIAGASSGMLGDRRDRTRNHRRDRKGQFMHRSEGSRGMLPS